MSSDAITPSEQPVDDSTSALARFLEGVGAPFVMIGQELRGLFKTFWMTAYFLFFRPVRWREVVRQAYLIGNRSVVFVTIVMSFFGLIMVIQTAIQADKIMGDLTMIGALFLQLLFRILGPIITAAMIAIRVGTGLAAEIGSMVVTEQVDALRMNDANPIRYLIVPRMLACTGMAFVLTCIASLASFLTSMAGAYLMFDVNPNTYYNTVLLMPGDLVIFVLKTFAFGLVVPVIGCHAGLEAYGGSQGVGIATTRAVVNATLAIAFLDFLLSGFGYVFLH